MSPKVSIIITAYMRREFVMRALKSVEMQRVPSSIFETILIKDFEDVAVDQYCSDKGVINIRRTGTIGEFLSTAIRNSNGDIIAFLDDDDEWSPDKLLEIIRVFESDDKICYFHNDYVRVGRDGHEMKFRRLVEGRKKDFEFLIFPSRDANVSDLFRANADFNLSSIAVRRTVVSNFINELATIEGSPDGFFFFLSMLYGNRIYVSSRKLTRYRVHGLNDSLSSDTDKKLRTVRRQLSALYVLENIFNNKVVEMTDAYDSLKILKLEYEMLELIFSNGSKLELAKKMLSLLKIPKRCSNPLRIRIFMFSCLYLVIGSRIQKIFKTMK